MTKAFLIESVKGETRFKMERIDEDFLAVDLRGTGLAAASQVAHDGASASFGAYWAELARSWRGWAGARTWSSIEGDLEFSAEMDKTGHMSLTVTLAHGGPWDWRTEALLVVEAGQLESLATRTGACD